MRELLCLLSIILGSVVLAKISHVRAGAKVELLRETQKVECFKVSSVSRKSPVTFYFVVATHQSPFTYKLQLTSDLLLSSCNSPVTFYFKLQLALYLHQQSTVKEKIFIVSV